VSVRDFVVSAEAPGIVLIGFGAADSLQLTLESQQVIARAGRVLALGMPVRLRTVLERQSVEVTDLDHAFDGHPLLEAYAMVAGAVLARAENDPPAVFVSQGNPLFLNAINRFLLMDAGKRKLPVKVYPGVSMPDMVVSELGIDVGRLGLQTLAARGLVRRPGSLNPAVPLVVLQVAGLTEEGGSAESYGPLVQVLQASYPAAQAVTVLNDAGDGKLSRATVTLARFAELIPHINTSSALFIDVAVQSVREAQ
jgi:precorrin-6B methylase 1